MVTQRVIQSGTWYLAPARIHQVVLTADGVGATSVTLHDGRDANAPVVAMVRAPTNETVAVSYDCGLEVSGGLYVDVGTNFGEALIALKPIF